MDDVIRDERNIFETQKPKILEDEQRKQEKNDKIIEDNKQEIKLCIFKKNSKTKNNYDFFFVLHEGWMIVFSDWW